MRYQPQRTTALLFITPWLIGFIALIVFPFVASLWWSFCRYDLLAPPDPVGGEHFVRLAGELMRGEAFGLALWNTLYYALLSVPLSIALGIALAVLLSRPLRGRAICRTIIFLPSVLPVVAASVLWLWLLDPRDGVVNYVLEQFGLGRHLWFQGSDEFLFSLRFGSKDALILMALWGIGNWMVIYLAAIGDIPAEMYEAATIDGASFWQRHRHVTLPMLTPVIFFNLVMGIIDAMQAFAQAYVVSEGTGEPGGATLLVSLHLFLSAFRDLEVGYASAMAWLLFVLLTIATALLFYSAPRWVHYRGGRR